MLTGLMGLLTQGPEQKRANEFIKFIETGNNELLQNYQIQIGNNFSKGDKGYINLILKNKATKEKEYFSVGVTPFLCNQESGNYREKFACIRKKQNGKHTNIKTYEVLSTMYSRIQQIIKNITINKNSEFQNIEDFAEKYLPVRETISPVMEKIREDNSNAGITPNKNGTFIQNLIPGSKTGKEHSVVNGTLEERSVFNKTIIGEESTAIPAIEGQGTGISASNSNNRITTPNGEISFRFGDRKKAPNPVFNSTDAEGPRLPEIPGPENTGVDGMSAAVIAGWVVLGGLGLLAAAGTAVYYVWHSRTRKGQYDVEKAQKASAKEDVVGAQNPPSNGEPEEEPFLSQVNPIQDPPSNGEAEKKSLLSQGGNQDLATIPEEEERESLLNEASNSGPEEDPFLSQGDNPAGQTKPKVVGVLPHTPAYTSELHAKLREEMSGNSEFPRNSLSSSSNSIASLDARAIKEVTPFLDHDSEVRSLGKREQYSSQEIQRRLQDQAGSSNGLESFEENGALCGSETGQDAIGNPAKSPLISGNLKEVSAVINDTGLSWSDLSTSSTLSELSSSQTFTRSGFERQSVRH